MMNLFPSSFTDSVAYTFQNDGGLITFTYPEGSQPNKKKDIITLGFVTKQKDAILARIDSDDSSDYIEMEIVSTSLDKVKW